MAVILDNKLRIGVAGAGLIGQRHVGLIQDSPRTELAFIADPASAAADSAQEFGVPHYASLADGIASTATDGIVIATPNHLHVENGLTCIGAGLPMLIEKPIADRSEPASALIQKANASNIPILVGHHRRHNPIITAAKERLEDRAVGDIVAVHASFWLYKPNDYFSAEWRTREGAGPVFINLIHDIDLLRYLVGEIASVVAVESSRTRGHEVEDTAAIILNFENGAIGTVTISDSIVAPWSWELTAAENPAYPETGQTCYQIGGTRGSLEIPTGRIWSHNGERSWWEPISSQTYEAAIADPLVRQLGHFCDIIQGKAEPLVSGEEGVRSLQVIEAIKRSARMNAPVEVSAA